MRLQSQLLFEGVSGEEKLLEEDTMVKRTDNSNSLGRILWSAGIIRCLVSTKLKLFRTGETEVECGRCTEEEKGRE